METKIISFANLKGGVGKSTLTTIVANYMNEKNYNFCVVDCDDFQQSLMSKRQNELENDEIPEKKKDNLYKIYQVNSSEFISYYENNLDGIYDYVIVDIPGNLEQKGVKSTIVYYNYLFIPLTLSAFDTDSLEKFIGFYRDNIAPILKEHGKDIQVYGIIYNENKRTRSFKDFYFNQKDNMPFPFMENVIPYAQIFKDYVNTYQPYYQINDSKGTRNFNEEFLSIINSK